MCQSSLKGISAKSAAIHTIPLPFVQGEIPIKCPMPRKPGKKPKLTDAERYKRFVDMAHEVGASDNPKDFEKAFKKVVAPKAPVISKRSKESNE